MGTGTRGPLQAVPQDRYAQYRTTIIIGTRHALLPPVFKYSLYSIRKKYYIEQFSKISGLPETLWNALSDHFIKDIADLTFRDFKKVTDVNKDVTKVYAKNGNTLYPINPALQYVVAILRRIGFTDYSIERILNEMEKMDAELFYRYLCAYMYEESQPNQRYAISRNMKGKQQRTTYEFDFEWNEGLATIRNTYYELNDGKVTTFSKLIKFIMSKVLQPDLKDSISKKPLVGAPYGS